MAGTGIGWPAAVAAKSPSRLNVLWLIAERLGPTFLDLAGHAKPAGVQGKGFLGPHAEKPRRYVFGARDRGDESDCGAYPLSGLNPAGTWAWRVAVRWTKVHGAGQGTRLIWAGAAR